MPSSFCSHHQPSNLSYKKKSQLPLHLRHLQTPPPSMDSWDLEAVVRGCNYPSPSVATEVDPIFSSPPSLHEHDIVSTSFPDLSPTAQTFLFELEELCRPFITSPHHHPPPQPLPPASYQPLQHRMLPDDRQQPQITRTKKSRKNQLKKVVCEIPVDGVAPDLWAWRKYGQKPIKGSPYPRGYYRCSSSKGCPARKQVERSRADPGVLVITYTAEHNHPVPTHRSSLAGSTRNKVTPLPSSAVSPTSAAATVSPSIEDEEEMILGELDLTRDDDLLDVSFFPQAWMGEGNDEAVGGG